MLSCEVLLTKQLPFCKCGFEDNHKSHLLSLGSLNAHIEVMSRIKQVNNLLDHVLHGIFDFLFVCIDHSIICFASVVGWFNVQGRQCLEVQLLAQEVLELSHVHEIDWTSLVALGMVTFGLGVCVASQATHARSDSTSLSHHLASGSFRGMVRHGWRQSHHTQPFLKSDHLARRMLFRKENKNPFGAIMVTVHSIHQMRKGTTIQTSLCHHIGIQKVHIMGIPRVGESRGS